MCSLVCWSYCCIFYFVFALFFLGVLGILCVEESYLTQIDDKSKRRNGGIACFIAIAIYALLAVLSCIYLGVLSKKKANNPPPETAFESSRRARRENETAVAAAASQQLPPAASASQQRMVAGRSGSGGSQVLGASDSLIMGAPPQPGAVQEATMMDAQPEPRRSTGSLQQRGSVTGQRQGSVGREDSLLQ